MRSVIVRPRLIVALLAAALLTGCGAQPSKAGSAAIVGDHAIPVSTVESRFDSVLQSRPRMLEQLESENRKDELASRIAAFTVRQELADRAARRQNLRVPEQRITEWIERQGGAEAAMSETIFTADQARSVARSLLLMRELGSEQLPKVSVRFDYTSATTRAEAKSKAERMARGPEQAAELIAEDSASGSPAGEGRELRAANNPRMAASTPLFAAESGTVLAFRGSGRSTRWMVARITERRISDEQGQTPAMGSAAQLEQQFGARLLGLTAQRTGVELSPRYGVWDPVAVTAVPEEEQRSGFRL
ncbi:MULTISPECIES: SurA N-terminal domain-containing protein [unclassified Actinopolyspora]|uniref:SurA N-terminal domain-containing protein n=1 Tax=Actinopolyspora TaxID=1849 RepID=UPI0013F607A4|nr:hypothetical protein [Actinopolyspora sp. BKK2]NHE77686.1 hypothetical protein [Actinopolyspora sp. BKK1]